MKTATPPATPPAIAANLRHTVQAAALASAEAEAALALAESALTEASKDDGEIEPTALVRRIDEAEKLARHRRIEANRAGAAMSQAEEQLLEQLPVLRNQTMSILLLRKGEEFSRLEKELTPLLAEPSNHYAAACMGNFINCCQSVAAIERARAAIDDTRQGFALGVGSADAIAEAVEDAGKYI